MIIQEIQIPCLSPLPEVTAEGMTKIPISSISLWPVDTIPSVYVFPVELDIERLKLAIGLLSRVYPTIGGRFEKDDTNQFYFNLTQSEIPLEIQALTSPNPLFPNTKVVQETLVPFLPKLGDGYTKANTNQPLFKIRLTNILPSGKCVLGISWAHILGDALTLLNALKWFELFYVNLDKALDSEGMGGSLPNFGKSIRLLSSQDVQLEEYEYLTGYSLEERSRLYRDSNIGSERLDIVLTQTEIDDLKKKILDFRTHHHHGEDEVILSSQDVLTGWYISLLRRTGQDITGLVYVCDFRRFCPHDPAIPSTLPNLAANSAQFRNIDLPSANHNSGNKDDTSVLEEILGIAMTIRKEILRLRNDPNVLLPWLSNTAHFLEKAAIEEKGQYVIPSGNEIIVNSHIRADWHLNFGFPKDETSFHCSDTHIKFLRIYQANPIKREHPPVKRIELVMNVPQGLKGIIEDLAEIDRSTLWIA